MGIFLGLIGTSFVVQVFVSVSSRVVMSLQLKFFCSGDKREHFVETPDYPDAISPVKDVFVPLCNYGSGHISNQVFVYNTTKYLSITTTNDNKHPIK